MPKRKVSNSDEENYIKNEDSSAASAGQDSEDEKQSKNTSASTKQKQKQNNNEPPVSKKLKEEVKEEDNIFTRTASTDSKVSGGDVKIYTTPEGDQYIDLGKKKRAVVRSFKGVPLIDIREFYGPDGQEKPGKKGIALNLEQWQSLKGGTSAIDKLLEGLKKK